ncbi:hypothetical protein CDD82_4236 [Ophiocordyceps australis]|uniref:Zn(2)-C6 fungal-type domain-containing protein n=1 Tax=Ophiocordyceps australis TaxID=1399860 RepID=A0A2C5Z842_9HYPO|nr:hypothetical protein CDD82_4236 [Ophiocordyceps australis]
MKPSSRPLTATSETPRHNVSSHVHEASSGSSSWRSADSRPVARKRKWERRGHTKSRRGCLDCKRRRIKCQETRPECGHCLKIGLDCQYPSEAQLMRQPQHRVPVFSFEDMRFFHYFLTKGYPHHPLKQQDIWTHEIPSIAHNHEFLMHAILGLAASELSHGDASLVTAAISYRVRAVSAIKKRLVEASTTETTYEEANALVATCFALTFQSVSLDDGLAEYMTFIRGIFIVGMQMLLKGISPIFGCLFDGKQNEAMAPVMQHLPLIQKPWVDASVVAISGLRPLCATALDLDYYHQLLNIASKLYTSSFDAYKAIGREYGWWMMLPHASFQELINFDRPIILLMHTHWIALKQIMAPITEREHDLDQRQPESQQGAIDPGSSRWLKYLNARVREDHCTYNKWPQWVEEQLDLDVTHFGKSR